MINAVYHAEKTPPAIYFYENGQAFHAIDNPADVMHAVSVASMFMRVEVSGRVVTDVIPVIQECALYLSDARRKAMTADNRNQDP